MELKKQLHLFNQLFKVKIMPLVIYGLGVHAHACTYTHILWRNESDHTKIGVLATGRYTPGLKSTLWLLFHPFCLYRDRYS